MVCFFLCAFEMLILFHVVVLATQMDLDGDEETDSEMIDASGDDDEAVGGNDTDTDSYTDSDAPGEEEDDGDAPKEDGDSPMSDAFTFDAAEIRDLQAMIESAGAVTGKVSDDLAGESVSTGIPDVPDAPCIENAVDFGVLNR